MHQRAAARTVASAVLCKHHRPAPRVSPPEPSTLSSHYAAAAVGQVARHLDCAAPPAGAVACHH
eukprot:7268199-Prymnesium_polylepis.1